jgi:hypothetical protein
LFGFTSLHRRFGLGVPGQAPIGALWNEFTARIASTSDTNERVAIAQHYFAITNDEAPPPAGTVFGCFNFTGPQADGAARIHFVNRELDPLVGPLSSARLPQRQAELRSLLPALLRAYPQTTHILGRSWLYHREAYRRIYPLAYTDAIEPLPQPVSLVGSSSWGQYLTHNGANQRACDAFLVALKDLSADDPLGIFMHQPIQVRAPIEVFVRFYGIERSR